jgi:hypothetical protein
MLPATPTSSSASALWSHSSPSKRRWRGAANIDWDFLGLDETHLFEVGLLARERRATGDAHALTPRTEVNNLFFLVCFPFDHFIQIKFLNRCFHDWK